MQVLIKFPKYRANLLYRDVDGSSWGGKVSESDPALVALVGFAGKFAVNCGERAI